MMGTRDCFDFVLAAMLLTALIFFGLFHRSK